MAAPNLTNTLTNGQNADADEVMQNFNDLLNGITDGTKDLTISALTCNGNVTLGDAASDTITFTGQAASNFVPSTAATYDLGSTTKAWQALYLDNTATDGGAIYFDAGSTEYIKANAAGTNLEFGAFTSYTAPAADNVTSGWAFFDGTGVLAVNDSYNVSSVTDNGVGQYLVNWDTDFKDTNYCLTYGTSAAEESCSPLAVGQASIKTWDSSGVAGDAEDICLMGTGARV